MIFANDLFFFFFLSLFIFGPLTQGVKARAGIWWAPVPRPLQGLPLLPSAGGGGGGDALSDAESCHPLAFKTEKLRPLPAPRRSPSPEESWRLGVGVRVAHFEEAAGRAPGGFHLAKNSLHSSLPAHHSPPPSPQPTPPRPIPPSALHPLGGGRRLGCRRSLTLFSAWKWNPSFRQRGRKVKSPGSRAKNTSARAGGGLGLDRGSARGGARAARQPKGPLTCCWIFRGVSLSSRGICVQWKHPERERDRKQIAG